MLELQYVSQKLLSARSLELAVPGTYRVNGAMVRIRHFLPTVQVHELIYTLNTDSLHSACVLLVYCTCAF
jgi:hypothetical protein